MTQSSIRAALAPIVVVAAAALSCGSMAVAAAAQASPAQSCSTGAYAQRPTGFSYTVHVPRLCGGQARAAALVNGQWVHGGWISRPGTSKAYCKGSCPPIQWRAWGYDWRRNSSSPYRYHQIGHSILAGLASARSPQVVRWSDRRNCLYKVQVDGVGAGGFTAHIRTDTCHHSMWAVARCGDGTLIYGNIVTSPGHASTTRGSCGIGNFSLLWWGVRDNEFLSRGHIGKKLHCLSKNSCNDSGGLITRRAA